MKIYNMDIGFNKMWYAYTDAESAESAVVDAIYDMMDHDRGAKMPFDVILSDLQFDGLETITLTATQRSRVDGAELYAESVSMTLGELFGCPSGRNVNGTSKCSLT